jgi:hypothetical protein
MSQQFNVSPDNLWMAMDYTPTSKTVVNRRLHKLAPFLRLSGAIASNIPQGLPDKAQAVCVATGLANQSLGSRLF